MNKEVTYNTSQITRALHKTLEEKVPYEPRDAIDLSEFWSFRQKANDYLTRNPRFGRKEGINRVFTKGEAADLALFLYIKTLPFIKGLPTNRYKRKGRSGYFLEILFDEKYKDDTSNYELQISQLPNAMEPDIDILGVNASPRENPTSRICINLWWLAPFLKHLEKPSDSPAND